MQPTRGFKGTSSTLPKLASTPAWPCSRWGLPGRVYYCTRRWSLTPPFHPHTKNRAVLFCGPFRGLPRPGITRHRALWSADFPQIAYGYLRSPGLPMFHIDHTFPIFHRQPFFSSNQDTISDKAFLNSCSAPLY
jgi:hypothetical protein